MIFQARWLG